MKTVYVVYWAYDGGGGFDWYDKIGPASRAFAEELKNQHDPILAKENWVALFKVMRVKAKRADMITEEIEYQLYRSRQ